MAGSYFFDSQLAKKNPMDYVNQTLKAEIRQISKSQTICQVKFIEIEAT